jgi:hypothetical protein
MLSHQKNSNITYIASYDLNGGSKKFVVIEICILTVNYLLFSFSCVWALKQLFFAEIPQYCRRQRDRLDKTGQHFLLGSRKQQQQQQQHGNKQKNVGNA